MRAEQLLDFISNATRDGPHQETDSDFFFQGRSRAGSMVFMHTKDTMKDFHLPAKILSIVFI